MRQNIAICTMLLFFTIYDGYAMDYESKHDRRQKRVFQLKDERRQVENTHTQLMGEYVSKCPKGGSFSFWHKLFFPNWVGECRGLNTKMVGSREVLEVYDKRIEKLKK
jgi:hypothetical protein